MASKEIMTAYVGKHYSVSWAARLPEERLRAIYYKLLEKAGKIADESREVRGGEQLCLFYEGTGSNEIKEEYLK